jgi:hypothetical protein
VARDADDRAHEAYPGHHWHLTHVQTRPRLVRKVFGTPYFSEGWGLYVEEMMRRKGFFTDPRHELCQVDARLFRAARIVVDTSLHMGEMTVEEAVTFMSTKASLSEPTARAEVGRYCTWPTQASSYLTGALEIDRIHDLWMAQSRGSLREFHDTIAGSGCSTDSASRPRRPRQLTRRACLLTAAAGPLRVHATRTSPRSRKMEPFSVASPAPDGGSSWPVCSQRIRLRRRARRAARARPLPADSASATLCRRWTAILRLDR